MLANIATIAASLLLAAVAVASSISGTLGSVAVQASGTSITVIDANGAATSVPLAPGAVVRERAAGADWNAVSIVALKSGEPIVVQLDSTGRAAQVDAEYALVLTRCVIVQDGYLVGTDGQAYKLGGAALAAAPAPLGAYVELWTDPATGNAFDAQVSVHPFAQAGGQARRVTVTFEVRVPINTPPASTIYIATNAQNWTPNAIRLSPEPGDKWTAAVDLTAGTVLQYKYTRGSWASGETDLSGSQIPNRSLTVVSGETAQHVDDVVQRWADLSS